MSLFHTPFPLSYSQFRKKVTEGRIIIDHNLGRDDIKTTEWKKTLTEAVSEFGSGIMATCHFHPRGPLEQLECINGQARCNHIMNMYEGYSAMSKVEQVRLDTMEIYLCVASRELTQDERGRLWPMLQSSDSATLGEILGNLGIIPSTDVIGAVLELAPIATSIAEFQHKMKATGSNRGRNVEMIARLFHADCTASRNGYQCPTDPDLVQWIREYREGDRTREQLARFVTRTRRTIQWLSAARMYRRNRRAVYLPVFLMFKFQRRLARKFTDYMENNCDGKSFTFKDWSIHKDPCRAGSNEYWRRYMAILANV